MRLTIKTKLYSLTTAGLLFVGAVSATGYWGITSVNKTTDEVAATGSAIRNHIEAGMYNDLTRTDTSAVFTGTGDDQQNAADEFAQHCKLLKDRIAKAQSLTHEPASSSMLASELELIDRYIDAGTALIHAIIHKPGDAPALLGPDLQLYKELQGKIEQTSDQLGKSANAAELRAKGVTARATQMMFAICGVSLLMLFLGSFLVVRTITGALGRLTVMIQDIVDGEGDVTKRLEAAGNFSDDELGEVSRLFNVFMDKLQGILRGVVAHTRKLTTASQQLLSASQQITTNSGETASQSNSVSLATQQVTQNLNSLSIGAGEMTTTIQSIGVNANEAAKVATAAVGAAHDANDTVAKLNKSSEEIGEVIKVITSIAQQTNLLALNATIEAARAGEAGKGFAVVANEVKELAKQTAKATEDIGGKISAIQEDTHGAIAAIGTVSGVINQINNISATIAAAVEEQGATTSEMTRNAGEAATGAGDISVNIGGVARAADGTLARAKESEKAAQDLVSVASELGTLMRQFKIERSDRRFKVAVPVKLKAFDANGGAFEQEVTTVDVSRRGANLRGVRGKFEVNTVVSLARLQKVEQFLVAWVGEEKTARAGSIGVSAIEADTTFWNDVIERETQNEFVDTGGKELQKPAKHAKASTHQA